jgi:uncharacterized membrane protein YedE/YeeE
LDALSLSQLVPLAGFVIGLGFGAALQLARFCTMGAIADLLAFGDATRLRMWAWAALVAVLGTQALIGWGGADLSASIYTGRRIAWLSQALGGLAFGFGMVWASGCPSRALARLSAGNLKALVVLLVVGLGAQMALRGLFARPRVEGLDRVALVLAGPQDLPSWLSRASAWPADGWRLVVCLALAVGLSVWLLRSREFRRPAPLLGGAAVGALVCAAWWVTGVLGHLPEHPETLEEAWLATDSRRPEALSFVAPSAYTLELLTLWSDRGRTLSFGIATLLGTLVGGWASALWRREFRWEGFRDPGDLARHLGGAMLMGVGGVAALGCSIGQGVSGLSLLSAGSVIAVAGIAAGAVAALRLEARRIERVA